MDHFWALIKTLGVVIAWIVGMTAFILFAAFGIPFLGEFFWNNGKAIFACLLSLFLVGMVVVQYFDFLKAEREKREKKKQESGNFALTPDRTSTIVNP